MLLMPNVHLYFKVNAHECCIPLLGKLSMNVPQIIWWQKYFAEMANFKLELPIIYENKYLESMWVRIHTWVLAMVATEIMKIGLLEHVDMDWKME